MSIFQDDAERDKYFLSMSAQIYCALITAPSEHYGMLVHQLTGASAGNPMEPLEMQAAIFNKLKETFKNV